MVSFLIPTVAFAESDVVTFGTAIVQNDQATNDSIVISMSGVTPAAEGSPYNVVLVSGNGTILKWETRAEGNWNAKDSIGNAMCHLHALRKDRTRRRC